MLKAKWLAILTASSLMVTGASNMGTSFEDLSDHWAEGEIMTLYEKGYVKGVSKTQMNPSGTLSRMESVVLVHRLVADSLAVDDEKWYEAAVRDAKKKLWIPMWSEAELNQTMTRLEMIQMIYSAEMPAPAAYADVSIEQYTDLDTVDSTYHDAIKWATATGILKGQNGNRIMPDEALTRAEGMVIVNRLLTYRETENPEEVVMNPVDKMVGYSVKPLENNQSELIISWGEKPTGGYVIKIDKVLFNEADIVVYYTTSAPNPDDLVTQAITYPKDSVIVSTEKIKDRKVKLIYKE